MRSGAIARFAGGVAVGAAGGRYGLVTVLTPSGRLANSVICPAMTCRAAAADPYVAAMFCLPVGGRAPWMPSPNCTASVLSAPNTGRYTWSVAAASARIRGLPPHTADRDAQRVVEPGGVVRRHCGQWIVLVHLANREGLIGPAPVGAADNLVACLTLTGRHDIAVPVTLSRRYR